MNQTAFLRDMDAAIAGAFADAGMADAATYTAPGGGTPAACTVLVDRAVQFFGDDEAQIVGSRDVLTLYAAEIAAPARGGVVTLTGTGEAFKLDKPIARDESMSRWVVVDG